MDVADSGPVGDQAAQSAVSEVLLRSTRQHGLLLPRSVSCDRVVDRNIVSYHNAWIDFSGDFTDPGLLEALDTARPDGVGPDAEINTVHVKGYGIWIDACGNQFRVDDMARSTSELLDPAVPLIELEVFHDLWISHDFHGRPQPEVYARNGPRLEAVIRDFDAILQSEADPDDNIIFGNPRRFGLEPGLDYDDTPMDVTGFM